MEKPRWSFSEISRLKHLKAEGKTATQISITLSRSFYSVCHELKKLGLANKHWTKSEDEKLRLYYYKTSHSDLLKILPNRNWKSIEEKARRLSLKRGLSPERLEAIRKASESTVKHLDEAVLKNLYLRDKLSTRAVAKKFGVSHHTVRKALKNIGIKIRGKLESLISKPTIPEQRFIDICKKLALPFEYTGNGSFWLENLNPDFVHNDGKKIAVEIFSDYWHNPLLNRKIRPKMFYDIRKKIFENHDWNCIIFWEDEIMSPNAEQIVLRRIGEI